MGLRRPARQCPHITAARMLVLPGKDDLDTGTNTRGTLLRDLRSQGERGFSLLKERAGPPSSTSPPAPAR